jgi:hypothetical protein
MSRACLALLILFGFLLTACGDATVDDSITALQDSYNGKDFDKVITDAGPLLKRCAAESASGSSIWRVERLRLESVARQGEDAKALAHLERLSSEHPGKVDAKLYCKIGGFFTESKKYQGAIDIFDAGKTKYPDMAAVFTPQIDDLKQRVLEDGSDADKAKLRQLGYL